MGPSYIVPPSVKLGYTKHPKGELNIGYNSRGMDGVVLVATVRVNCRIYKDRA